MGPYTYDAGVKTRVKFVLCWMYGLKNVQERLCWIDHLVPWNVIITPSLKLTFSHVRMDVWNTIVSFWMAYFQGRSVSFRECNTGDFFKMLLIPSENLQKDTTIFRGDFQFWKVKLFNQTASHSHSAVGVLLPWRGRGSSHRGTQMEERAHRR